MTASWTPSQPWPFTPKTVARPSRWNAADVWSVYLTASTSLKKLFDKHMIRKGWWKSLFFGISELSFISFLLFSQNRSSMGHSKTTAKACNITLWSFLLLMKSTDCFCHLKVTQWTFKWKSDIYKWKKKEHVRNFRFNGFRFLGQF